VLIILALNQLIYRTALGRAFRATIMRTAEAKVSNGISPALTLPICTEAVSSEPAETSLLSAVNASKRQFWITIERP
ncbi:hypothetical protein ACC760_40070, partial [Rhizobium ruizarguesonis]